MPFVSPLEAKNLKLQSLKVSSLRALCLELGLEHKGNKADLIQRLMEVSDELIDAFIRKEYSKKVQERRKLITDDELKAELRKVKRFKWGIKQGDLDRKIQAEYVRQIPWYDKLLEKVRGDFYQAVEDYITCTWYNHWTNVLIEEHIAMHPRVVPTVKPVKGIDLFFDGQPFDLKVTYLPEKWDPAAALNSPKELAKWLYENQGPQRFGPDNRMFIVVFDSRNPSESWKLKRNFPLLFGAIDTFLDKEKVTQEDEIVFAYPRRGPKRTTYTAVAKVLLITV